MTVKAIYRDGSFVPEAPIDMPEGAEVELTISGPTILPPEITDPEERRRRLQELVDDMANRPWPEGAPRFTREELHERR
jgi:predicted DNA-binding antitoxin AbrB/MazE fold protein